MSVDPIHRIGAGPPSQGIERIGPLPRVERRPPREEEPEERPRKRAQPPRRRPDAADGHVDVQA